MNDGFDAYLLNVKAGTQQPYGNGWTALHMSVILRDARACKELLEGGHSHTPFDDLGRTPLHIAAGTGNAELCRLLLDAGASVFDLDGDGKTPLERAVRASFEHVVAIIRPIVWRAKLHDSIDPRLSLDDVELQRPLPRM